MRRAIVLKGHDDEDISVLEISKATKIRTKSNMMNLEEMKDGTWRLIWSESLLEDFSKLKSIEIIRE